MPPSQTATVATTGLDFTAFFWLLLAASVVAMAGRYIKIPYALALVVTGLLIGAPHLIPQAHLDPHILFTVFLPPLLFETAINLRIQPLKRDWRPILVFAMGGTFLSTFLVGWLSALWLGLPLVVALVFGSLISTTDPVSVVAVFKRLGVGKRLSLLMEAESLFNDGASVVLFGVLTGAAMGLPVTVGSSVQTFLSTVLGGAGVGIVVGWVGSRITREFDEHLLEITLTTIVAFGSYLIAEYVHVSGVIAVVSAGLVIGNYGMQTGMSPTTRLAVISFWEYAGFVVNSIVFLLLGIEVTFVNLWKDAAMVGGAIVIVLLGRALAVYLLSPLVNRLGGHVPLAWQHVLFWGGLRGALSMALVLGLPPTFPQRAKLVALSFGVVLFSLLAQGLSVGPLLKRLGLSGGRSKASEYARLSAERLGRLAALRELDRLRAGGLVSRSTADSLEREYRDQVDQIEGQVEALHLDNEAMAEQQKLEARRLLLLAEKSAVLEASRSGIVDEEDSRWIVDRADRELSELQGDHGDGTE